jgi:3-oxosteroid 1-dehydrogenase
MAAAVGAQLDHMDQALIMGVTPVTYEGRLMGQPAADYFLPHSMIVNRHGRRFVNEKQMNIGLAFAELDLGTGSPAHLPAWRIYDSQFAARYPHAMPNGSIPGNRFEADTLGRLAVQIDVDPAGLAETARRFSAFARTGVDDDFGRGASLWDRNRGGDPSHKPNPTLGSIEKPPFYAMPFKAGYLGTKGGARTNERAEVLNGQGEVIGGLYAAGNVMANAFGSKGVGAGTTLGPCMTWGYIAALNSLGA